MIMKQEAPLMAFRSGEEKNNALRAVAEALRGQKEEIFRANKEDLERAEKKAFRYRSVSALPWMQRSWRVCVTGSKL